MEDLLSQLEKVQNDLSIKEAELKHLTLQLEMLTNRNDAHVTQLQEQIAALKVSSHPSLNPFCPDIEISKMSHV